MESERDRLLREHHVERAAAYASMIDVRWLRGDLRREALEDVMYFARRSGRLLARAEKVAA